MVKGTIQDEKFDENYWYIFGVGYDLEEFFDKHPGGRNALIIGKGRDCTNLVLSYHFRLVSTILPVLEKYKTNHVFDPYNEYEAVSEESSLHKKLKDLVLGHIKEGKRIGIKFGEFSITFVSYILMWVSLFYLLRGSFIGAIAAPTFGWLPASSWGHDGSHFAIFASSTKNYLLSMGSSPLYFNSVCWTLQHVVSHHQFTNDVVRDVDMHHGPDYARSSIRIPLENHMPYTVKVFLFFLQMLFSTWAESILYPILLLKDYFAGSNTIFSIIPNKHLVIGYYLLEIIAQLCMSLVIFLAPIFNRQAGIVQKLFLSFVPFWISSFIFIICTQWAHLSEKPQKATAQLDQAHEHKSFAENQILRSLDILPHSFIHNFITGGLNCQSLHHMIPKVHNSRYRDFYPEYFRICKEYGISPNFETSIVRGYLSYVKHLLHLNSHPQEEELVSLLATF